MILPVVVGITGASGAALGLSVLDLLSGRGVETHLVVTRAAERVLGLEANLTLADLDGRATRRWANDELAAPIASGTFPSAGMIVAPCSMSVVSAVATSRSTDLLERAADVTLKERRPLVLIAREAPLHVGHLRQLLGAAEIGATILPPVPPFYARIASVTDMVEQIAARAIDCLGIDVGKLRRWQGPE
ncbi:MAG: UbiX family flavin prenyltransferase [Polyangiaceae bacterium]|nr:UbiX family flavin prenyltransferase [Polyangiaceae bacterium]